MRYRIHVSGSVLARNAAEGTNDPPIIVRENLDESDQPAKRYTMAHGVECDAPGFAVIHDAGRVWLESDGPVYLIGAADGLDRDQPEPPEDV